MEKTQNGRKAEFRYDYFGRLAEKHEEGLSTFYRYDAWGNRTARVTRTSTGLELAEERTYDRYGRLTEIRSDGKSVKYEYDRENRLARQIIDNIPVDFEYTKYNQLAAKYFGGKLQPVSTLRYFYAPDGTIVAREVGGELQRYTYDKRGQLLPGRTVHLRQGGEHSGKIHERRSHDIHLRQGKSARFECGFQRKFKKICV